MKITFFMFHQKDIPIEEFENSTRRDEYEHLYSEDGQLKGSNITIENEVIVDYGNDFSNCKIIHDRHST